MQEETQRKTPGVVLDTKYSTVSGGDEKCHLTGNQGPSAQHCGRINRLLAVGRYTEKPEEKTKDSV